ncbi:transporter substrate-binding domain-containing protein [Caballeronia sordidicola]|uniref:Putative extracellular solute-binding protein n=1 Tax=Caballeronia sordidicola TaxID=196367 RepID=A0A242MXK6_CABSO|nr:transporter substrate-binding domain-containing protein [Caballeronia sordidicola]OTP76169.1 putative extracellular solute-binding protein [Caballeronia sordidicola]
MAAELAIREAFAPSGVLRISINFGNPILATKDAGGKPKGISVDLANELASALALPLELVSFDAAGDAVTAVAAGDADVGFFAIDTKRGEEISFTAPYILIEGNYLVRTDSLIRTTTDVDKPGIRVAVGAGSAYVRRAYSQ